MSSAHLDGILVFRANDMQAALLTTLLPLVDALQDKIWQSWLIYRDHLHWKACLLASDHAREGFFANLTLKLGKVIGHYHAGHFLLDFTVNPHLEAKNMHTFAWALALAWGNKKVLRCVVITKAKLAVATNSFICLVDSVKLSQKQFSFCFIFPRNATNLDYSILDPAEFYNVSES